MSFVETSKLRTPRRICSCRRCGTRDLLLVRTEMIDYTEYTIEHNGCCKEVYWYCDGKRKINTAVKAWNDKNEEWIDGFDLVWFEVDRVYDTRWDCMAEPEGVRLAG